MKLAVAFWSGQQPDGFDTTLDRLDGMSIKGLGHINVSSWEQQDISATVRGSRRGTVSSAKSPYTTTGGPWQARTNR